MTKILHEGLSREIIGIAMQVLNELKPGLDEKLYERAMIIELQTWLAAPWQCNMCFLFYTEATRSAI